MENQNPDPPKKSRRPTSKGVVFLIAGLIFVGWLLNTPPGILGKADAVGYALCHRIDTRSYFFNGRQAAMCTRCTGMYVGASIGLVYLFLLGKRRGDWPGKGMLVVLGLFFVAFGVDGLNSTTSLYIGDGPLYTPHNTLRLITGTGMGVVLAVAVVPAFHQTVWWKYSTGPVLENWGQFGGLLALCAAFVGLILTQNSTLILFFSLVSVVGSLTILTLVYAILVITLLRKENEYDTWRELAVPLAGGFCLAMLQIILLDLARFFLTGSWGGFHLILG